MLAKLRTLRARFLPIAKQKLEPVAMLLLRVVVGLYFVVSGWGKVHNLDKVTAFFTELHIPMPHVQAIFISNLELFGGLAIVLGLLTRIFALLLSATMVVAILTAKLPDLGKEAAAPGTTPSFGDKLGAFFSMEELLLLAIFVTIAAFGPGPLALDRFVAKAIDGDGSKG